jgi:hypothetical protein
MISELFRQQGKPGSPRPSQTATAPAPALAKGTAKARKVKRK